MALLLMFGLSLAAVAGVLTLRGITLAQAGRRRSLDQIAAYGFRSEAPATPENADVRSVFGDFATKAGEQALARFDGLRAGERGLRRLLNSAGMYQTTVALFVGARVLGVATGATLFVLFALSGRLNVMVGVGCALTAVMGWFVPLGLVQRRARLRLTQIDREVPELVDLLVTTVEGGVGFAAGLQLASRGIEGPLGQELRLALREQSLGLSPEEALRNLSDRVDSPAASAFTQALLQGESLGVSIGTILRDLAIDMRDRRRQSAEEQAQKTPVKILFPLIFLILPAIFTVTLGPVMMDMFAFFSAA